MPIPGALAERAFTWEKEQFIKTILEKSSGFQVSDSDGLPFRRELGDNAANIIRQTAVSIVVLPETTIAHSNQNGCGNVAKNIPPSSFCYPEGCLLNQELIYSGFGLKAELRISSVRMRAPLPKDNSFAGRGLIFDQLCFR